MPGIPSLAPMLPEPEASDLPQNPVSPVVSSTQPSVTSSDQNSTSNMSSSTQNQTPGAKTALYDISGKEPVLGHIDHSEVTDAIASGRFSFPKGSPVNVLSPDGTLGTLDPSEAPEAFKNGYTYATPKDIERAKYADQTLGAGLEGLAQGVAGPLATLAETTLGIAGPKDIRGRAEANPIAHGLGETAGFIGSLATGVGEGALVADAGKFLSKGIEGAGLMSDAARGATKAATEMALLGTGDELSKMITQDPNQTAQSAITNIGLSAALGGFLGGTASGVSSLWKASGAADKLGQLAADVQGRLRYHLDGSTISDTVGRELGDHLGYMRDMGEELKDLAPGKSPEIMAHIDGLEKQFNKIKDVTKNPEKVEEFLDAADKYKKFATKLFNKLEEEPSMAPTSLAASQQISGAKSHGAELVDYFVKHAADAGSTALGSSIGATAGHMTGIPGAAVIGSLIGNNVLSPAFKSITSALLKPIMETAANGPALKAAIDYAMSAAKGNALIGKASTNLFRQGAEILTEKDRPTESDRVKLNKQLMTAQANPQSMLNSTQAHGHYLPPHGAATAQIAQNAVNLINQQRPSTDKASPLDSKPVIDKAHQAAFNRTLDIAQQPLMVLHHIKEGTLQPSDVATIQQLYPQLHQKLSQDLTNKMIDHLSKPGNSVPYKTRIGLSMFLAQPLDSTMKPEAIMAAQPKVQQGPQMQGSQQPTKHSTTSLTKVSSLYQTKSQNRELDRNTKS